MKRSYIIATAIVLIVVVALANFYFGSPAVPAYKAGANEIVQLNFPFDKKIEFGEYYFDLDNGDNATYPLCFCLTEKNSFPPECHGDVKYIYRNLPGSVCVPLSIGKGRCGVKVMSSSSFATIFMIPLEYGWTKPFETITLGIKVPAGAPIGARLHVLLTIHKRTDKGNLVVYRKYSQYIDVHANGRP